MKTLKIHTASIEELYRMKQLMGINEEEHYELVEGVSFNSENKTVWFNPLEDGCVNTNKHYETTITAGNGITIPVYSIFTRVDENTPNYNGLQDHSKDKDIEQRDGNPLIYALKGDNGWHFIDDRQKRLLYDAARNVVKNISGKIKVQTTILAPSNSTINKEIASIIKDVNRDIVILEDVMRKITPKEILQIVKSEYGGELIYNYCKTNKLNYKDTMYQINSYLSSMKDGKYSAHNIKNRDIRNAISKTVSIIEPDYTKIEQYNHLINGKNIMIIDDLIREGDTLKNILNVILNNYSPKSIVCLTLLSPRSKAITKPYETLPIRKK